MKSIFLKSILVFSFLGVFLYAGNAQAVDYMAPEAHVYDIKTNKETGKFYPFDRTFKGGGKVAVGDMNADDKDDILVGAGRGGGPQVRMFNEIGKFTGYSFFPFHPNFRGGVDIDMADTDGDGKDEMIVSQFSEGQAWVKVYEFDKAKTIRAEFIAYGGDFQGGAHVAGCDINGDGKAEIITGSGVGSTAHVRAFDGKGNYIGFDIFPFEKSHRGGVDVACANVDGGAESEIVVGKSSFGQSQVKVYKTTGARNVVGDFKAFDDGHREGVNIAGGDVDNDGKDEIIVGTNGNGPQVKTFEAYGKKIAYSVMPYKEDFRGGVNVAFGNVDGKDEGEIVTMPGRRVWEGRQGVYKYIEIDVGKQRLFAYQAGRKVKEFPISSGTFKYPSPIGDFRIWSKPGTVRMKHEYGPNHPDNYDIPDVASTMYFHGPYALHAAYWHNNFGNRMSHGCVNIRPSEAAWLFQWSNVGDRVYVRP
ncbi:L,D-transpeptidase family protein [Patescibacteria group bacterium]|nr:L,D-transpeptidase family protein [Patescibacteria group bacterium]